MGGGDLKIPHYKKYNEVLRYPEVVQHVNRLKLLGLRDPWVRNIGWVYHPLLERGGESLVSWYPTFRPLFLGLLPGIAIAVSLILFDKFVLVPRVRKIIKESPHDFMHPLH